MMVIMSLLCVCAFSCQKPLCNAVPVFERMKLNGKFSNLRELDMSVNLDADNVTAIAPHLPALEVLELCAEPKNAESILFACLAPNAFANGPTIVCDFDAEDSEEEEEEEGVQLQLPELADDVLLKLQAANRARPKPITVRYLEDGHPEGGPVHEREIVSLPSSSDGD